MELLGWTAEELAARYGLADWNIRFDSLAAEAAAGKPIYFEGAGPQPAAGEVLDAIVIWRDGRVTRARTFGPPM